MDYVKNIGDQTVEIIAKRASSVSLIKLLGGVLVSDTMHFWRIGFSNEDDLAKILQTCLDDDMPLVGGPAGWPPAAVGDLLREKGKLHGLIQEVV